jgi:hypothetical protein
VLEIGSGNLRNVLYIANSIDKVDLYCYEIKNTIEKFLNNYKYFKEHGGKIIEDEFDKEKYDAILSTFFLETICPQEKRICILKLIKKSLSKRGVLVASFRGYTGVLGSKYKKCPEGEGLISPLHTFIKPYSIIEIEHLLASCGFNKVIQLQNYKVNIPKNIHIVAS